MTTTQNPEDTTPTWRKASRSNAGNNCVEIARTPAGYLIRDSKNPAGLWLRLPFGNGAWTALIEDIKNGEYAL